jgi:hypothetical protein
MLLGLLFIYLFTYYLLTAMPPLGAVIYFFWIYFSSFDPKIQKVLDKCVFARVNWIKISFFLETFGEFEGSNNFPILGNFWVNFQSHKIY